MVHGEYMLNREYIQITNPRKSSQRDALFLPTYHFGPNFQLDFIVFNQIPLEQTCFQLKQLLPSWGDFELLPSFNCGLLTTYLFRKQV
jgi:hypothetical protein